MEENLKEKLFNKRENGWDTVDTRKKEAIFSFTKDYMNYLNKAKTEREFIVEATKKWQKKMVIKTSQNLKNYNQGTKYTL